MGTLLNKAYMKLAYGGMWALVITNSYKFEGSSLKELWFGVLGAGFGLKC